VLGWNSNFSWPTFIIRDSGCRKTLNIQCSDRSLLRMMVWLSTTSMKSRQRKKVLYSHYCAISGSYLWNREKTACHPWQSGCHW
jgi:hypothetical protein